MDKPFNRIQIICPIEEKEIQDGTSFPSKRNIYIDGMEIKGCVAADLQFRPNDLPTIKLEIVSTDIEVDDYANVEKSVTYTNEFLNNPIEHLELSTRAYNCIKRGLLGNDGWSTWDINNTIGDVVKAYKNGHLKKYKFLGRKTYDEIVGKLEMFKLVDKNE